MAPSRHRQQASKQRKCDRDAFFLKPHMDSHYTFDGREICFHPFYVRNPEVGHKNARHNKWTGGTIGYVQSLDYRALPGSYMRKPEESLEDFTVKAIAIEKASEPARVASLHFRGQVEVLRPLASWDGPADAGPPVSRLPWFQRSLAVVGGLAVIALMFLSAIFF